MDAPLKPIFTLLQVPDIKIRKPFWVCQPSGNQVLIFIFISYFLVTGGVIYDVVTETPSMGSETDQRGNSRPVAFMKHRISSQYILEGIAASFMFMMGGMGFIFLDKGSGQGIQKLQRSILQFLGIGLAMLSFVCCWAFLKMKLPGYSLF